MRKYTDYKEYLQVSAIKLPEQMVLDFIRNRNINLFTIASYHLWLSRKHYNIKRKEFIKYLKVNTNLSSSHITKLLNDWKNKPYILYEKETDTFSIKENYETYYERNPVVEGFKQSLIFNVAEFKYTGNKLRNFLYCEIMHRPGIHSISRDTIYKITKLSKETQKNAEIQFGVNKTEQFVELKELDFKKENKLVNHYIKKSDKKDNIFYAQQVNVYSYKNLTGRTRAGQRGKVYQHQHKFIPVNFSDWYDTKGVFVYTNEYIKANEKVLYPSQLYDVEKHLKYIDKKPKVEKEEKMVIRQIVVPEEEDYTSEQYRLPNGDIDYGYEDNEHNLINYKRKEKIAVDSHVGNCVDDFLADLFN